MIHVAVVHARYLRAILAGVKTVESRLSAVRCEPFRAVAPGERIYFKARGGPVAATALVRGAEFFEELRPRDIADLRLRFARPVAADESYWRDKRRARFATFITLGRAERVSFGPEFPPFHGRAWLRLPDSADVYPACLAPVEPLLSSAGP